MVWQNFLMLALVAIIYVYVGGYSVASVDRFWMKALLVGVFVGAPALLFMLLPIPGTRI